MKKTLLFVIMLASFISVQAVVKVAYITFQKTMDASGTTVQNDPIIQMLSADPNLAVTVKVLTTVAVTDVISDLTTYDVIIVQESFAGAAPMLMPAGALALKTIPKPFIYNKTYALKSGRALGTSTAAGGKEATACLTITVQPTALTNDLFKACTIGANNDITLFNALMTDTSVPTGTVTTLKAINYSTGNIVSGASSTILAVPTILNTDLSPVAICINDIPAGTSIDSETTLSRMITLSTNFGAICGNAGKNITDDGLTLWRNAVYILGGLTVPATKVTLPVTELKTLNSSSEVISVVYYNVNGIQVLQPKDLTNGIFVKRTTYQSGLVQSEKVVFIK
ncbi:MAG: hypothetical protein PHT07_09800 [Paludibacter sp.]|nr:hypothetical protein [Paludibacter sp.]